MNRVIIDGIIAALSIVIALSWRDAINNSVRRYAQSEICKHYECNDKIPGLAYYIDAVITTLFVVLIMLVISMTSGHLVE